MELIECVKGHYYDKDKYSTCPFCSGETGIDRSVGFGDDEGKTLSYDESKDKEVTQAFDWNKNTPADPTSSGTTEANANPFGAVPSERFEPVVGWLVCVEGPERGRDYRLLAGKNYIGRSVTMDVSIPDDNRISRDRHCAVIYDPRSYMFFVTPGDSALTTVNGEALLMPKAIKDNDVLTCGDTKLCFISFCKEGRDWE